MRKFSKLVKPKATRLTRFNRLFMPSVGPLETLAWCQATMGSNQLREGTRERAHLRWRRTPRGVVDDVTQEILGGVWIGGLVEAGHGFFDAVGEGHLPVGVAQGEQALEA